MKYKELFWLTLSGWWLTCNLQVVTIDKKKSLIGLNDLKGLTFGKN